MRIDLHPDAQAEVRSVALWYDERRPQWGEQFLAQFGETLGRITQFPQAFPVWPDTPLSSEIRQAPLAQFPYLVAYEIRGERILILAVAHAKRRPLYWITRASVER